MSLNDAEPDVSYRPGVRGWWAYWRPLEAIRDGDGVQWGVLWRRGRLSARLRQSEQERKWWRRTAHEIEGRAAAHGAG